MKHPNGRKILFGPQENENFDFEGGFLPPENSEEEFGGKQKKICEAGPSVGSVGGGISSENPPKCLECERDFVFSFFEQSIRVLWSATLVKIRMISID